MPKFGESLTKISLKDILSDQELEDLKNITNSKKVLKDNLATKKMN